MSTDAHEHDGAELFVADHILLGEGVRETVSFVSQQLEGSRFITGSSKSEEDLKKDEEESLGTTFYRYVNPSSKRARRKDAPQDAPLLLRAIMHFVKGSSLIGILSVFYTYVAATFVSPLGRGLFRALRPGGGRRRQDTGASMSQIVIVAVRTALCPSSSLANPFSSRSSSSVSSRV